MKNILQVSFFLAALTGASAIHAQVAPAIEWQKCLGGTGNEAAFSIQQTTDYGFIIGGYSDSNDGNVTGNHGADDYWIVKLDALSNLIWQKSLGGNSLDQANSVAQTTDGGYIAAGYSYSNNADVSGNHGSDDYWIVKLDVSGNLTWQKCFGGSGDDGATSIQQTADGGFIVAGWSSSVDGDVTGNHGLWDYWVLKLDSVGNLEWQNSFGGSQNDVAYSAQQTADGGFIIAGYSESADGDVSGNSGARDYWIVKADAGGNLLWQTVLGGSGYDEVHSIQQLTDGGFIVAGFAGSSNGDVTGNHGGYDYWLVKLDTTGNSTWKFCFGGTSTDQPFAVQQTNDDGFIVTGQSLSNNGDVSGNHGGYDFWALKLDSNANLEWQESLGGSSDEYGPYGVQQTADGGFIISGATLSNDNDVSGNHGGSFYGDWWVVKLSFGKPTGIITSSNDLISLYPNPVEDELTIDMATSASPVSDEAIHVFDLQGKMIALPAIFTNAEVKLNTVSLPDGFYVIQITNSKTGNSKVVKFVKGD